MSAKTLQGKYAEKLEERIHNLYVKISNLQQENKQLKEDLKDACYVIEKIKKEKQQAIEYIKENANNYYVEEPHYRGVELLNIEELLEILGDKE